MYKKVGKYAVINGDEIEEVLEKNIGAYFRLFNAKTGAVYHIKLVEVDEYYATFDFESHDLDGYRADVDLNYMKIEGIFIKCLLEHFFEWREAN